VEEKRRAGGRELLAIGFHQRNAFLQIEPIEVRKADVKDQATRGINSWACAEFLCGRECLWLPACITDQQQLAFVAVAANQAK